MAGTRKPFLLIGAMLLPVLYFGVQLALAPTFPGYSFLTDAASLLGSDRSPYAVVFNTVALLSGVCGVVGAVGLFGALRQARCPILLAVLIFLAVLLVAAGCIWAGVYPLPDPRHGANPTAPGLMAVPVFVAAFLVPALKGLRIYLVINLVVMIALVLVMSGALPVDRVAYGGLVQRLIALAAFGPIGIAAATLWRKG